MRQHNTCIVLTILLSLAGRSGLISAASLPPGFAEIKVADGLNPTAMALAPDGSLFLAQKDGRILLIHSDGTLHDEPFANLQADDFNERGLCGIAVHPHFETEPWVYVYYTVKGAGHNRISRIRANGDFAVPGSEQILLELPALNGNIHNGGALVFGPDDHLFAGVGDGANPVNAQNLNTLLGKILRLNADGSIPASNPFYQQANDNNRAIYAYGVRNPFSMSTDPATGRVLFCDVGNGLWEEVNELLPGKNYGWSLIEGPLNGQPQPPDFQPPLYAYPHSEGCAVVGAAFGFGTHPLIPAAYQGQFLFADYCQGWIRMLDPGTGLVSGSFATGIDRPVSLLVSPNGDLYYFARAGLGGGSPDDNTVSTEGSLWKIFWTGDGAPLITGQPQSLLLPIGETATFNIQAFGHQPLDYQWFKNGAPIPGATGAVLTVDNLTLPDSGAWYGCLVSNSFGSDTSALALLRVTGNQRPIPEILFPSANATYRGGDTLYFAGQSTDPEEGALLSNRLSWRIDFHHANHTHPALPPVPGISEGLFFIPTEGETATDVFYRVYLTATDSGGLVKTVWRDVHPEFTTIHLDGPPGVPVNIDGQIRPLPAGFESVVQLQRHIEAPVLHHSGDTTYLFRSWSDGFPDPLRSFSAPANGLTLGLVYDRFTLGNGSGLRGAYFFDPNGDFNEPPALIRIDTTVQFNWADNSPDPDVLPADYFTVRWTGFVQPVFTGTYTFSVRSDDGCRLWVGDSLLIDKWQPQTAIEHSGTISVKGGQLYPIRLEYLEIGGGALVELRWSSALQPKQIIPKRQLYPDNGLDPAILHGTVGIDENGNGLLDALEKTLPGVQVSLYQAGVDTLVARQNTLADGRYYFASLLPGAYYLQLIPAHTADKLTPSEHLDTDGHTPVFELSAGESLLLNTAWILATPALYGTVWLDVNNNGEREPAEAGISNAVVLLYRADSTFVSAAVTNSGGGYLFSLLEPREYFLLFELPFYSQPLAPGYGLNDHGQTPNFNIGAGNSLEVQVAFAPGPVSGLADPPSPEAALTLYPNPAHYDLWVNLELSENQNVTFEVFDLTGKTLYRQRETAPSGQSVWRIQVHDFPPGVYLFACSTPSGRWQKRWIRQ